MKWQFLSVEENWSLYEHGNNRTIMDLYGSQGWELVSVIRKADDSIWWYFKKPL